MIAVLDYGIGNLRSAEKALLAVGADARLVDDPDAAAALKMTAEYLLKLELIDGINAHTQ